MKLLTELSDFGNGDAMIVFDGDATHGLSCDEQLERDAYAAHALMQAIAEMQEVEGLPSTPPHIAGFIQNRAAELMREWGFEEKVTP